MKQKHEITESHFKDILMTIETAIRRIDNPLVNQEYINRKISDYCDYLKEVKLVTNK